MAENLCAREKCANPLPPGLKKGAIYCSRRCQKAVWDEAIVAHCSDCGRGITQCVARMKKGTRCVDCKHAGMARAWEARASIIADMWEDGWTRNQIAEAFGWTGNRAGVEIAKIRQRKPGLLPHRRSPEAVANIRAGWQRARKAAA